MSISKTPALDRQPPLCGYKGRIGYPPGISSIETGGAKATPLIYKLRMIGLLRKSYAQNKTISLSTLLVGIYLIEASSHTLGYAHVPRSDICRQTGRSPTSVTRATRELVKIGFIRRSVRRSQFTRFYPDWTRALYPEEFDRLFPKSVSNVVPFRTGN